MKKLKSVGELQTDKKKKATKKRVRKSSHKELEISIAALKNEVRFSSSINQLDAIEIKSQLDELATEIDIIKHRVRQKHYGLFPVIVLSLVALLILLADNIIIVI